MQAKYNVKDYVRWIIRQMLNGTRVEIKTLFNSENNLNTESVTFEISYVTSYAAFKFHRIHFHIQLARLTKRS